MIFDGTSLNVFIAFLAGIVTFFASCLSPLVPAYLAFLSGVKKHIFRTSLIFVLGFIAAFTIFGATASIFGAALVRYRNLIQKIGGVFFVLLGSFMLGLVKPKFLLKEHKITKTSTPFLTGFFFGFAWTPCIGPVLAVIIFWASQTQTFFQAIGLLLSYGIGIGVPFLLVGAFFKVLASKLTKAARLGRYLNLAAAIVIIIFGLAMIFDKVQMISIRLLEFFKLSTLAV